MKLFTKSFGLSWFIPSLSRLEKKIEKIGLRVNALSDLLYYHEKYFHKEGLSFSNLVQEEAWGGLHGYRYVMHHLPENWYKTRVPLWQEILHHTPDIENILEYGSNIGANLEAIRHIMPSIEIGGIEINPLAVRICRERGFDLVNQDSIIDYKSQTQYDFVFSRGVLIHIPPQHLNAVFTSMYSSSKKYILIWENYSEKPYHLAKYSIQVRENYNMSDSEGYQFWRDFAGEFQNIHKDVKIVARSKNIANAKKGDLVWTLFRK